MRHLPVIILMLLLTCALGACDSLLQPTVDDDAPANLTYQLIPSGDPAAPAGVLLTWDVPRSGRANSFNVYSRNSAGADWLLRGTTTSPTFHDAGVPQSQYYIATGNQNGDEIAQSDVVTIDLAARLPAPQGLTSISLDAAVHLSWSSNAVDASPSTFDHYIVYSTGYDATRGVCTASWVTEGSTVSDGFLAGNMANGVTRCFAVSAITRDGHESQWSPVRTDTPRAESRSVVAYAATTRPDCAAFLFSDDSTHRLGVVTAAARANADFTVQLHADGSLWLTPVRTGATVVAYAGQPVADLTTIDRAPSTGYASTPLQARPGMAYVFRLVEGDGVHFAALRVAYVAADYVVFDWSYQQAIGNVELSRGTR